MRIRIAVPEGALTPQIIEHALEATTLGNQQLLAAGQAVPLTSLIQAGARWRPEPFKDGEHFDLLPEVGALTADGRLTGRGWFDCDDAAPAYAAQLRVSGEDPGARAVIRKSGVRRWHAIVQKSDGSIVDPSTWGGMPSKEVPTTKKIWPEGVSGMYVSRRPGRPGFAARCDLPMETGHLVGVSYDCATPAHAIANAVAGVGMAHVYGPQCFGLAEQIVGACPTLTTTRPGGALDRGRPMMVRF